MIPIAVGLGAGFVYFFIWATKDGQFDDLDTPSVRMLIEDQDI
jgi:cbb3-type cytochrome oxidase maturation protein